MNYNFIKNEVELNKFLEWLPQPNLNEIYLCHLQIRSKYLRAIKSHDKVNFINRFTFTNKNFTEKVRRLECKVGSYKTKSGNPIPEEAFVLYITPNPRSLHKATKQLMHNLIEETYKSQEDPNHKIRLENLTYKSIHGSKSKTNFLHFDIDFKQEYDVGNTHKETKSIDQIYQLSTEIVGIDAITLIQTKEGCHLLIDPTKVIENPPYKPYYKSIKRLFAIDNDGDIMLPVPGCVQGDTYPKFYQKTL